ncbi:hypothetical protein A2V56_01020 [Candidatus Woesebacteria bacterium RBG_19FT_COMBO_42_9]|uniref:DUF5671 domain-containing protein n=1 Tax=Candidatus Woesebacteria bacterium RBG_16_42_24 TaxID=1802485 RepID=A0A1F7XL75_9BACT|nr:MAG: hypothetical protein A2V97_03465 [Candidatus Woesebacteria bacterium RBG_16_42_24]OGM17893.1 MAG: hypothetical protein A2V56_01020 [Candidatus Woesebacteria bacterium RBG_19FT_COMBO_42_9]OGM68413.1 MAG: hypothetical protein A2985_01240 [Candidatus Woesebacteria bacterium RIFCSPLOWO2_01_FULL_43_11]
MLPPPWSDPTGNTPATFSDIEVAFARIVLVILGLAAIVLFIMLLVGGFKFITAGGDPKAVESAKKTLTYAIAGMVLVASAYLILRFIGVFTGIDVVNFRVFQPLQP